MSYVSNCIPNGENIVKSLGFVSPGYFNLADNKTYLDYNYISNKKEEARTLKHEKIHSVQLNNSRLSNCSSRAGRILNEIEANSGEYIPDFIFKKLYGNY